MNAGELKAFLADKADSDQIIISTNYSINTAPAPKAEEPVEVKAEEVASESKAD